MKSFMTMKNKENKENPDFAIPLRKQKTCQNQQIKGLGKVANRRNIKANEKAASK